MTHLILKIMRDGYFKQHCIEVYIARDITKNVALDKTVDQLV